jgi:hypothetical protein
MDLHAGFPDERRRGAQVRDGGETAGQISGYVRAIGEG